MIRIERTNLLALAVILTSIAIGLAPLAIQKTSVQKVHSEFNTSVTVKSVGTYNDTNLGINPGKNFQFGEIEPNANYTKWVRVSVKDRSKVRLTSEGNISELLIHREDFYFEGEKRIAVKLFPSKEGYYEGKLVLEIWSPKNEVGRVYLDAKERFEQLV